MVSLLIKTSSETILSKKGKFILQILYYLKKLDFLPVSPCQTCQKYKTCSKPCKELEQILGEMERIENKHFKVFFLASKKSKAKSMRIPFIKDRFGEIEKIFGLDIRSNGENQWITKEITFQIELQQRKINDQMADFLK